MEELLKALNENKELSAKVKKLWQEKASAADLTALLKEEGYDVDVSAVEEALKKTQDELAKKVAMEKLDDEALDAVAGGGSGVSCTTTDDCDSSFKDCVETLNYYSCDSVSRCDYTQHCDELFA